MSYTPIHDLLTEIIEETGFGIYISAMEEGGVQEPQTKRCWWKKQRRLKEQATKDCFILCGISNN